jgi:predicted nuclease of predicted toxin-antitoxin system
MRFKVDENLPEDVADLLRSVGHDAHSIHEERLAGALDQRVAEVAQAERRTLVTLDLDFADVRQYPPREYAGIVVMRLTRQDKPHVLATMRRITPLFATEPVAGRLWIVEDDRIRIR